MSVVETSRPPVCVASSRRGWSEHL